MTVGEMPALRAGGQCRVPLVFLPRWSTIPGQNGETQGEEAAGQA
jgi:hypothetical protein